MNFERPPPFSKRSLIIIIVNKEIRLCIMELY